MSWAGESIISVLNPADCFTLAMDEEIRKEGMPGSLCGFALELDNCPDIRKLSERIDHFCANFLGARASLRKIGRRFYWCKRENQKPIFYLHESCVNAKELDEFHEPIVQVMNRLEARDALNPLEFHLFQNSARTVLLIRWIHPFCDAVGAGLILRYLAFDRSPLENALNGPPVSLLNERLDRFSLPQKFNLLLKAKKLIEQIDSFQSILPHAGSLPPKSLNFRIFQLSLEQSRKISEASRKSAGLIGTSLYSIGCLMRAIDRMESRGSGEAYCIPYAFNLRKQKATSPVIGNHVCVLFAQAPVEIVQSRERLFRHLTDQYRVAISSQLDYAFLPLMWIAQWMSLEKYGKALRQSYRSGKERSSFWFSDIDHSDLDGQKIFGASISGVFHLVQVSTPPGLALLTCIYQNRLTLSYNFVEPLFDRAWIGRLHQEVLTELLGIYP
ncbi:MAG: hypothetical protein L0Y39_05305 [Methylococcaceae bacterium]|nr:hypothetical protein [Methylococcaceae bacterium]